VITPIAEQIARNGTADVIFSGGLGRFEPDDEQAMKAQEYQVLGSFGQAGVDTQTAATQRVATREELKTANAAKVIGLFNRGNLTVKQARRWARTARSLPCRSTPPRPSSCWPPVKAAVTGRTTTTARTKGQDAKGSKGFQLQVEGALIDKRSHANDAAQTLMEMKAFDDAVKVAKDFAAKDGNTLVITTADHECAGFNIIGNGSFANAEAAAPPGQHRLRQHREQQLAVAGVRGKQEGPRPLHRPGQRLPLG